MTLAAAKLAVASMSGYFVLESVRKLALLVFARNKLDSETLFVPRGRRIAVCLNWKSAISALVAHDRISRFGKEKRRTQTMNVPLSIRTCDY